MSFPWEDNSWEDNTWEDDTWEAGVAAPPEIETIPTPPAPIGPIESTVDTLDRYTVYSDVSSTGRPTYRRLCLGNTYSGWFDTDTIVRPILVPGSYSMRAEARTVSEPYVYSAKSEQLLVNIISEELPNYSLDHLLQENGDKLYLDSYNGYHILERSVQQYVSRILTVVGVHTETLIVKTGKKGIYLVEGEVFERDDSSAAIKPLDIRRIRYGRRL